MSNLLFGNYIVMKNIRKNIYLLLRISVGALFTFSGFVKMIDPIGTAIKLEEYFEVFSQDFFEGFALLAHYTLYMSVILCFLEVVLGMALFLGIRMRKISMALIAMDVSFLFLTFYSAYFDKVTDCGCFGDFIPLDPWQSFWKDVILLVLLLPIYFLSDAQQGTSLFNWKSMILSLICIISLYVGYHGIHHLPLVDFRPYAVGKNIQKQRQPKEPCQYLYYMEKEGRVEAFEKYPTEKGFKFIRMEVLNEQACKPAILDYYISGSDGEDYTEASLNGEKTWVIVQKHRYISDQEIQSLKNYLKNKMSDEMSIMFITSDAEGFEGFIKHFDVDSTYFFADGTVLKAMIRSNPGIIHIKDGTILEKYHINDIPYI